MIEKLTKIRALLANKDLSAIVIRKNPNLAWLIGGRVHVPLTLDTACLDIIVYQDKIVAVTNKIEAPRLIAEELPSEIEVIAVNWWESRDSYLPFGEKIASDQSEKSRLDLSLEIEMLRQTLTSAEITRFKEVCVDSAKALGAAIKLTQPNDREIDISGRIANALWQNGLELVYIGVAGESRVRNFRHALPTHSLIGNRVVASICARRKGMIASVTRIATYENQVDSYKQILKVESALFNATNIGARFSEPIKEVINAYPRFGFDSDEWQKHHQGGPTGFAPRDWVANSESQQIILENQPIAWNPTGNGWKAEDTILARSSGIEILSEDPDWPTIEIEGRNRPNLLLLSK